VHDTPRQSKTKKNEEAKDVHNTSSQTPSISPEKEGDGGEIDGTKVEQKKEEVTLLRDEDDPSMKRKVSPSKPPSRKKMKETRTKFETTITSDDFEFIVAALNDASLEIEEKQEAKQEEMFSQIKVKFQEVQKELQSSHTVSTAPLTTRTPEMGDEPTQLHQIVDTFKACFQRAHEETTQSTQTLAQAQGDLLEQRSNEE
jgi:hypothetical protein